MTLCCDLRKQEQLEGKCGRWREQHMQRSAACQPRAGGGGRQARVGGQCKELGIRGCGAQEMCRVRNRAADGRLALAVVCWGQVLPAHETQMCHFQDCCQAVVELLVA